MEEVPKPPKVNFYQPLNKIKVCENNICKEIIICKVWSLDEEQNKWILVENADIKKCNGIFGVTTDDFNKFREFGRELKTYIENNCGTSSYR